MEQADEIPAWVSSGSNHSQNAESRELRQSSELEPAALIELERHIVSQVDSQADANHTGNEMSFEEFGQNCLLIRNVLTIEEQLNLVENINAQKKAMQDEIGCDGDDVSFDMESEDMRPFAESAPGKAVSKAKNLIALKYTLQELKPVNEFGVYCVDARFYGESQTLPYHCDGIKKRNCVVFLFSLGRTAKFYIHCPEMGGDRMGNGKLFEFNSGDLLFFDATKEASIYHGIESIYPASSCPSELMGELSEKRVGLQIRAN